MKTSEKTDKILELLAKVKTELTAVTKDSNNPFFKSKYADLNSHLDAAEPLIEKHGGILLQPVNSVLNIPIPSSTVESLIFHVASGQFVSSEMVLILPKNTMQDAGSAVTYARRYTLGALLSMKAEDDDANVASGREIQKSKPAAPVVKTSSLPATNNTVPVVLTPPNSTSNVSGAVTAINVPIPAGGSLVSTDLRSLVGTALVSTEALPIGSVQATPLKKSTFRKTKTAPIQSEVVAAVSQDSEW